MSEINLKIDTKLIYAVVALMGIVGAGAVSSPYFGITDNPVQQVGEDLGYRLENGVQNVINNMISGSITVGEAKNYIQDEKFYAKQYKDGNAVETEVNLRYISYLNAASDVTTAYGNFGNNSPELENKLKIMQEKKDLI
jgi:hypothetical protein